MIETDIRLRAIILTTLHEPFVVEGANRVRCEQCQAEWTIPMPLSEEALEILLGAIEDEHDHGDGHRDACDAAQYSPSDPCSAECERPSTSFDELIERRAADIFAAGDGWQEPEEVRDFVRAAMEVARRTGGVS